MNIYLSKKVKIESPLTRPEILKRLEGLLDKNGKSKSTMVLTPVYRGYVGKERFQFTPVHNRISHWGVYSSTLFTVNGRVVSEADQSFVIVEMYVNDII